MRYLASVVTQCFTSFGELLALNKRFAELTGGVTRYMLQQRLCLCPQGSGCFTATPVIISAVDLAAIEGSILRCTVLVFMLTKALVNTFMQHILWKCSRLLWNA